jgi:hypothetical protein
MIYCRAQIALWGILIFGFSQSLLAQSVESHPSSSASASRSASMSITAAEAASEVSSADAAAALSNNKLQPKTVEKNLIPGIYKPERESYVATIELLHLAWPNLMDKPNDKTGARLALGIARPHYGFKKELSMAGSLDLKIEGIFHGVLNSARVTLIYDMHRALKGNDTRMNILVDRVTFKVGIPVGR